MEGVHYHFQRFNGIFLKSHGMAFSVKVVAKYFQKNHHFFSQARNTRFFFKQRFFSTQPQCCLTFSWTELQILLRCCLLHNISIIILRHFLYLLCLGLGLFVSYLCDLFFIFISIFIMINRIIPWIQTYLLFLLIFRVCPITFVW